MNELPFHTALRLSVVFDLAVHATSLAIGFFALIVWLIWLCALVAWLWLLWIK